MRNESDMIKLWRLEARNKTASDKAAKETYEGDPDLLKKAIQSGNPEDMKAYRATMDPMSLSLIDAAAAGKMDFGKAGYALSRNPKFLEALSILHPEFAVTNVERYADMAKDYASGKSGQAMQAAGTALRHMYQLSRDTMDWNRLSKSDLAARTTDYENLVSEIARYKTGGTQPGKEELNAARTQLLGNTPISVWSNADRQKALRENSDLLIQALRERESRWKENAPSPQYEAQFPNVSHDALASHLLVTNNGKYILTEPNTGAKVTFTDPATLGNVLDSLEKKGQWHW